MIYDLVFGNFLFESFIGPTVTGTFLKLYITYSAIASKYCAKFCETDEHCISLIHYFTDCKQSFIKVI